MIQYFTRDRGRQRETNRLTNRERERERGDSVLFFCWMLMDLLVWSHYLLPLLLVQLLCVIVAADKEGVWSLHGTTRAR